MLCLVIKYTMGHPDKRCPLVSWMEIVQQDKDVDTCCFFILAELYELYLCTQNEDKEIGEELSSFFRLIKSIHRFGMFQSLKIKNILCYVKIKHRRISQYIVVNKDEFNLRVKDIEVHCTRQR